MHWIAHLFGLQRGQVVVFYVESILMVGCQCSTCGKISSVGVCHVRDFIDGKDVVKWAERQNRKAGGK